MNRGDRVSTIAAILPRVLELKRLAQVTLNLEIAGDDLPQARLPPNEMTCKFKAREPERTGKWTANGLGRHAIAQLIKKPSAGKAETRNQRIKKERGVSEGASSRCPQRAYFRAARIHV